MRDQIAADEWLAALCDAVPKHGWCDGGRREQAARRPPVDGCRAARSCAANKRRRETVEAAVPVVQHLGCLSIRSDDERRLVLVHSSGQVGPAARRWCQQGGQVFRRCVRWLSAQGSRARAQSLAHTDSPVGRLWPASTREGRASSKTIDARCRSKCGARVARAAAAGRGSWHRALRTAHCGCRNRGGGWRQPAAVCDRVSLAPP
mmetsp:Transcript_74262/g.223184  ORF Transcript_74262/g.223184 Transcript_74262/m.223184 type:complete len:205 (+) Transcript_74262:324-938(+)